MPKEKDKAEVKERKAKPKKPPEYRRFEDVLKKVVKAPPMKKSR